MFFKQMRKGQIVSLKIDKVLHIGAHELYTYQERNTIHSLKDIKFEIVGRKRIDFLNFYMLSPIETTGLDYVFALRRHITPSSIVWRDLIETEA